MKISHVLYVLLATVGSILAGFAKQIQVGDTAVPGWVLPAITIVVAIIGLFQDSPPAAQAIKMALFRNSNHHPAALLLLGSSAMLFGWTAAASTGCATAGQAAQVINDTTVGIQTALCVITTYSQDVQTGMPEADAYVDAAAKCIESSIATGANAVAIARNIVTTHHAAEMREQNPLPATQDGGPAKAGK